MNKALVEKLAVQSLVWVDTGLADGREQIFSTQKFAELIVRECIGCCEQVISDPVPKSVDTFEQGGIHCIDEIKQHFGVEL
jgi:hypothetical protein